MRAGVLFPSIAAGVTWTAVTGGWSTDYPLQNVADLIRPTQLARASAAGARDLGAVLPAARTFGGFALIGHNYPAGAGTIRVRAFSGTGNDPVANAGTMVFDSGSLPIWPGSSAPLLDYRSIRPVIPALSVTARSFHIALSSAGASPIEIEAIELAQFWEWPGISFGRETGITGADGDVELVGGGAQAGGEVRARILNTKIDLISASITSTTGLDFQRFVGVRTPFVFGEDFDDETTWARRCMLVTNQQLPPMVGQMYRSDSFPANFIEHLR